MSRRHHHHDTELFAKWFGIFLLAGGALWLVAHTYGLVLLLPIAGVWLYRRKTGRWPGLR